MDTLPSEILSAILRNLAYGDLLRCSSVCVIWKNVIQYDVIIQQTLFKSRSDSPSPELQIHPAMCNIRFRIGAESETMKLSSLPLMEHPVLDDLVSIPAVGEMRFVLTPAALTLATMRTENVCFTVKREDGVRVRDAMNQLAIEGRRPRDVIQIMSGGMSFRRRMSFYKPALFPTAELLGERREFRGLEVIKGRGNDCPGVRIVVVT